MSNKNEHRLGVNEVNLVVRHFKLEPADGTCLLDAIAEVDELLGLDDISFDDRTHVLNIAYDASRLCLDGIEDILKKHGVEISHDWWTRFKTGYYRFVDENVKDNASHEPWSCHQSPPTSNKRKN